MPASPRLVDEDLERVVCRLARAKPERARQKVRFEDRLEHDPRRGLHHAITDRGIDNGRRSSVPGFGMNTRRAGNGR